MNRRFLYYSTEATVLVEMIENGTRNDKSYFQEFPGRNAESKTSLSRSFTIAGFGKRLKQLLLANGDPTALNGMIFTD